MKIFINMQASTQSTIGIKPVQKIFFGSPGTGKSYRVKEQTFGQIVHRTTFHPDTDYTAFVGAYKPANIDVPVRNADGQEIPGLAYLHSGGACKGAHSPPKECG